MVRLLKPERLILSRLISCFFQESEFDPATCFLINVLLLGGDQMTIYRSSDNMELGSTRLSRLAHVDSVDICSSFSDSKPGFYLQVRSKQELAFHDPLESRGHFLDYELHELCITEAFAR